MACDPAERTFENPLPVPIDPSMLDVHAMFAVRFPFCVSLAEPVKVSAVPCATEVPDAGLVMLIVGAVLLGALTVTDTTCDAEMPPLSVTLAVITCDPAESTFEKLPP